MNKLEIKKLRQYYPYDQWRHYSDYFFETTNELIERLQGFDSIDDRIKLLDGWLYHIRSIMKQLVFDEFLINEIFRGEIEGKPMLIFLFKLGDCFSIHRNVIIELYKKILVQNFDIDFGY